MTGIRHHHSRTSGGALRRFGRGAAFGAAFMCGASSLPAPPHDALAAEPAARPADPPQRAAVRARVAPSF